MYVDKFLSDRHAHCFCRFKPFHADCQCGKGNVLIKVGRPDTALDAYNKAVSINPTVGLLFAHLMALFLHFPIWHFFSTSRTPTNPGASSSPPTITYPLLPPSEPCALFPAPIRILNPTHSPRSSKEDEPDEMNHICTKYKETG